MGKCLTSPTQEAIATKHRSSFASRPGCLRGDRELIYRVAAFRLSARIKSAPNAAQSTTPTQ